MGLAHTCIMSQAPPSAIV
uniref:Uncharacterized protein n=1 Tax=Rhizophora mucronata TaxID=61149 RepID=A0A2P2Q8G1_RHIMU